MKKAPDMEAPLNANERFLYAVAVRLDVIIEQNNTIIDHLAKRDGVAVTNQKVETKTEPKKEEAVEEVPKAVARKRPAKK